MAIAEAVISPLIDVFTGELFSRLKEEVGLICGVDKELDNISTMLSMIRGVLADAEEKQITNEAVKEWLAKLKNVAYDVEDVLEEFACEVQQQKLMEHGAPKRQKVSSSSFFSNFSPQAIRFQRDVAHKIMEINERVDTISRNAERFHLRDIEIRQIPDVAPRLPTSSLIPKNSHSDFFGRDNDREQIIDLLLSDEDASSGGKDVSVISIVGMGGLGKTTLAQLVYNDEKLHEHFQVKAWVCVSEYFNILRLTREIIESATGESCSLSTLDSMQCRLKEILMAKRFLIVLDDAWNTEQSAWDQLQPPFSYGVKGSKIIVTTRDEAVSRTMGTNHFYPLKLLSDDYCLSLFLRHAFVHENCNAHPELMEIGKDLVESHCHGLPLAAKVLGGLLSSKRDIHFWRSILNSQLWSSNEGANEVMKALRMSYHHLPPHMKQCFAFCSIFPKDYEFYKDELVKLWMAQGFIQSKHGFMWSTSEEIGNEYFDFLSSRSFFQEELGALGSMHYKMHDCIHDLAMLVSSDECFRFRGKPNGILASRYRHASMISRDDIANLKDLYDCKGIRTIIIERYIPFINQNLNDLIVNLRYLRVLNLKDRMTFTELPVSISNLKHLRYLNLSRTSISQLPESVSSLNNLQTLDLGNCYDLCQLPKETRKLANLRHLDLQGCLNLKGMPQGMGTLTNLQTLSMFIVGRERGYGIEELKGLTALRRLHVEKLNNVSNAKEVEEANMKDKKIDWLSLSFVNFDEEANTNVQHEEESEKILEAFQPHTSLKRLEIFSYEGKNFPSWFQSLTSLKELRVVSCPQLSFPDGFPPTLLDSSEILCCPELEKQREEGRRRKFA